MVTLNIKNLPIYIYIRTTLNNTLVTLLQNTSTLNKNYPYKTSDCLKVLKVFSCGSSGFKGRSKETPFAHTVLATNIISFIEYLGVTNVHVILKGIGSHRQTILKALLKQSLSNKFKILSITDVTRAPYNGCRPSKRKRR